MQLEMKCVYDVCSGVDGVSSFFIPSYQRGYRWTELQITMLLEDLLESFQRSNASAPYCLQPLAVQLDKHRCAWHVVDGQQRLTTLYILLRILSPISRNFSISYETRVESSEFLKNLNEHSQEKAEDNPDFHCMFKAWQTISKWLKECKDKRGFLDYIKEHVEFVWYRLPSVEDPYETFESLNSGKIALTNAELLKALLLRNRDDQNSISVSHSMAITIVSQEWDGIEQRLRDDAFWYFINPDAKDERFASTRIDFLFEVILRREILHAKRVDEEKDISDMPEESPRYLFDENWRIKKRFVEKDVDGNEVDISYVDRSRRNPYFSFSVFNEFVRSSPNRSEQMIWDDVKHLFELFESWYENKALFHLVGFLINRRGDDKFMQLLELVDRSRTCSRSDFRQHLLGEVKEVVLGKDIPLEWSTPTEGEKIVGQVMSKLSYTENKHQIHNFLLLFNIALTDRWDSEDVRFPFHKHANMSDKWSLEHIHAKDESFIVSDGENSDLFQYEEYLRLSHVGSFHERIERVNECLKKLGVQCLITCKEKKDRSSDIEYEVMVLPENDRCRVASESADETSVINLTHGIWNMALLDCSSNSSFKNGIFIRKLKQLRNWELDRNCDSKDVKTLSDYIPIGTKMAFHKEFTSLNTFPLAWTYADRRDYFVTMEKVVFAYLTR